MKRILWKSIEHINQYKVKSVTIMLILFTVYIVLCVFALYRANKSTLEGQDIKTNAICVENLDQLMLSVYQAESSQRGYVLTRKSEYLSPFQDAILNIRQRKYALILNSDHIDQKDLELVLKTSDDKVSELTTTIELISYKNESTAMNVVNTGYGVHKMEELTAKVKSIRVKEYTRLTATRANYFDDLNKTFNILLFVLSYAGISFLALVLILVPYLEALVKANDFMRSSEYSKFRAAKNYMETVNRSKNMLDQYALSEDDPKNYL